MPATRSISRSREPRPLSTARRTRATPSQTETSASELDAPRRPTRQRTRHVRKSAPITEESEERHAHRARRLHVRASLAGPQIGVLSIERRASMVADVAGDCLAKLLKWEINGDRKSRGKNVDAEWRGAWDGLQTLRRTYIFSEYASPFPQLNDVLEDLNDQVRTLTDASILARALNISNLTTFVYAILHPDEAGAAFSNAFIDEEDDIPEQVDRKGKRRDREGVSEMKKSVAARNRLLILAWKRFWLVVVPKEERESEEALNLWLDFATQIVLYYNRPRIQPSSGEDPNLPTIDQTQVTSLFSPSAVGRYGQWDEDEEYDSEVGIIESPQKAGIQRRWNAIRMRRTRDLGALAVDTSIKTFSYDEFRRNVIAFVQGHVLDRLSSQTHHARRSSHHRRREVVEQAVVESTEVELSELEAAENSLGEEEEQEEEESSVDVKVHHRPGAGAMDVDGPVALDMWQDIIAEMEAELETTSSNASSQITPSRHANARPSGSASRQDRSTVQAVEEDWNIRDRATPRVIPGATARGFDWRARQDDAVQVDWETQEPTPPRRVQKSTPPPVRAWGAQRVSLKDQISPRKREGTRGISEANTGGLRGDVAQASSNRGVVTNGGTTRLGNPVHSHDVGFDGDEGDVSTPRARIRPATELIRKSLPPTHQATPSRNRTVTPAENAMQFHYDRENDLLPSDQMLESDTDEFQAEGAAPSDDIRTPDDPHCDLLPPLEEDSQLTKSSQDALGLEVGGEDLEDERAVDMEVFGEEYESEHGGDDGVVDEHADLLPPLVESGSEDEDLTAHGTGHVGGQYDHIDDQVSVENDGVQVGTTSWEDADVTEGLDEGDQLTPRAGASNLVAQPVNASEVSAVAGPSRLGQLHLIEPSDYAAPDSEDDEDDRAVLQQREQSILGTFNEPPPGQARYRTASLAPSHLHPNGHRGRPQQYRGSSRAPSAFTEDGIDPYLVDENGDELEPDDTYVIPRDYKAQASRIHGRVTNQVSSYSRQSGRRKWTKTEEILLYRTVQKVPLSEEYPLRVVWYLHGEFGIRSRDLEMFNPQHMKDKMRVIVASRVNNRRDVLLRARFWLPKEHFGREEYDKEMGEYKKEVSVMMKQERERLAEEERIREEEEEEEEETRGKKGRGRGKGGKGRKRAAEGSDEEEEEDEDDEEEGEGAADGEVESEEGESVDGRRKSKRVRKKAKAKPKPKKAKVTGASKVKGKGKTGASSKTTPAKGKKAQGKKRQAEDDEEGDEGVIDDAPESDEQNEEDQSSKSPTTAKAKRKRQSNGNASVKKPRPAPKKVREHSEAQPEADKSPSIIVDHTTSDHGNAEKAANDTAPPGGETVGPDVSAGQPEREDGNTVIELATLGQEGDVTGDDEDVPEDDLMIDVGDEVPDVGEEALPAEDEAEDIPESRRDNGRHALSEAAQVERESIQPDEVRPDEHVTEQPTGKGKRVRISSAAPPVRRITRSGSVQSTQGVPAGKGMQRRGRSAVEELESLMKAEEVSEEEEEGEEDDEGVLEDEDMVTPTRPAEQISEGEEEEEIDSEDELDRRIESAVKNVGGAVEDLDELNEAAVRRAMILKTVRA